MVLQQLNLALYPTAHKQVTTEDPGEARLVGGGGSRLAAGQIRCCVPAVLPVARIGFEALDFPAA
jgi:hypothetical protein